MSGERENWPRFCRPKLSRKRSAMASFVSHLQSALDGTRLDAAFPHTLYQGRPIWVRYDLPAIRRSLDRAAIASRPPTLWRYRELLPPSDDRHIVTLGETMTPLLPCPRLGAALGLR